MLLLGTCLSCACFSAFLAMPSEAAHGWPDPGGGQEQIQHRRQCARMQQQLREWHCGPSDTTGSKQPEVSSVRRLPAGADASDSAPTFRVAVYGPWTGSIEKPQMFHTVPFATKVALETGLLEGAVPNWRDFRLRGP